jgi:hypothetical protein
VLTKYFEFARGGRLHVAILLVTAAWGFSGCGGGPSTASTGGTINRPPLSSAPSPAPTPATTPAPTPAPTPTPAAAATGNAFLSWRPPTANTDGTALTSLGGYRIYSGLSASAMSVAATLTDPKAVQYLLQNLKQGTWFFAVAALASDGTEGVLSPVASKTI